MADAAVQVRGLTKTFRRPFGRQEVKAVREVSLTVGRGEIFGLLGPNGAGKTTLVKMLLSIVRPTKGEATLFGRPVNDPAARARIGFLPENHRFPDFLTARQLLDQYARLAGVPADVRKQQIPLLLDRVGMLEWENVRIKKYSKGMMQRIGLAQALMNKPDLIFLDEPTDGVDPIGRREIRDQLLRLREEGMTVFLNSHLLSEIEQVCTRVAILKHGRLVREGRVSDMTTVERYYNISATPIPPEVLGRLDPWVTVRDDAPSTDASVMNYRVHAAHREQLNTVLDKLRAAGVMIEAVQPFRRSLEDYFIEVIHTS